MAKTCASEGCGNPIFSHLYCLYCQKHRTDPKWLKSLEKSVNKDIKSKNDTNIPNNKESVSNAPIQKLKSKGLNRYSKRMLEELKRYRKVRDDYIKSNPVCEFPNCNSYNVQLHHSCGRVGKLLTDIRYFKSLCNLHHEWVELHPIEAKQLGLSGTRLDK